MEKDIFLTWIEREISAVEAQYSEASEGKKKSNCNARLLALKECRSKYQMTRPE